MRKFLSLWLPVIAWMAIIFAGSSIGTVPRIGGGAIDGWVHRIAHIAEFAILGLLVMRAIGNGKRIMRRDVIIAMVVVALYGVSDEWHQRFVAGRNSELIAVVWDVLGGLIGAWVCRWWQREVADRQRING